MPSSLKPTPTQLLDVAERLFAEKGIDNVSIREIVRTSGQSNLSAAHYHFGTREALIGALIERRIRVINTLRHKRLDQLEATGQDKNIYAVVMAMMGVLGEAVKTMPWGPDYVRLTAQALFNSQLHIREMIDPQAMDAHTRWSDMLRPLLPAVPLRVFNDRVLILDSESVYSIARWIQAHGAVTPSTSRSYSTMIANTLDFLAAGMAAPVGKPKIGS
jgi:AcrR family transcriptional regulator